ncbi:S4 domain-containing protein YaaA [Lactobacillus selangorensis]|nr:S4 domain-containing protein YaaA [Lactobacillus selangorensis]
MEKQIVKLTSDHITLGQLLKDVGVIGTGGQAKWYLQENTVLVNGTAETRRGRKLVAGDAVTVPDMQITVQD